MTLRTGTFRFPEGVREVIGRRLDRLSEECNRLLITASLVGRECDFRLLGVLSRDTEEDRLFELLDEVLEARVIDDVTGRQETYQFSHSLIQRAYADKLSTSRKVRLHVRIGAASEELYAGDLAAHAAELAHHYAKAEPVTGQEKLVHYSLMAGEQALAKYA